MLHLHNRLHCVLRLAAIKALASALLFILFSNLSQAQNVEVEFSVEVPASTPADSTIYVAGNVGSLGPWQPDFFALKKSEGNIWVGKAMMPADTQLEYKYTRGSWSTVEKDNQGAEIENRRFDVSKQRSIKDRIASWAITKPTPKSTARGDLRWFEFTSGATQKTRRITVWLPPQYQDREARFPVIYMLDGQNVFDVVRSAFGQEWMADETAANSIAANKVPPFLIVALDNTDSRIDEYTPAKSEVQGKLVGGQADAFLQMLVNDIKPLIDRTFRTKTDAPNTTIVGSSLGGLFALYAVEQRNDIFGNAIAMSPSLGWSNDKVLETLKNSDSGFLGNRKVKIWVDGGTKETEREESSKAFVDRIVSLQKAIERPALKQNVKLHLMIDEGAIHNEQAWAKRLPAALEFVLGD